MSRSAVAAVLLLFWQPAFGAADPAVAFGARESVQSASLSPQGTRIAFIAPLTGQGSALFTVPIDGSVPPKRVIAASGSPERLAGCNWVSEKRLVCTVFSVRSGAGNDVIGISRMVGVDIDGSNIKMLSARDAQNALYFSRFGGNVVDWLPGQDGAMLMGRSYVPEAKIGSLIESRREGYGVDRIDTVTLATIRVVPPVRDATEYISDGQGNVRIMGLAVHKAEYYTTGVTRYMYRRAVDREWEPLGNYDSLKREGFNPYAVDATENVVYGFQRSKGRLALFKRALDGSMRETLVFERPDVDVDGLIRLGRKQRVVGVSFVTEKRQARYFDPAILKVRELLAKALPAGALINVEGSSDDEQKLLLWVGSDVDPGRYYFFDRANRQLRPLILSRPELADVKLATVKAINVRAADGTMIPGYLTLPPGSSGKGLPAIVMPHGGPGARDEWGFDWLAQFYANRGFAVLQPNFRGSTGYGDAWFQNNGFQSWRTAIGDVADSGRWLVSEGIADPAKLGIVGWSYGGYAALQSGVIAPGLFKAIVAIAPVTDLADLRAQYANTSAQAEARDFIGTGPHIREGSPAQNASAITAPVLMFHGDLDQNVRVAASRLMTDKLRDAGKRVETVYYPALDHYLEDSAVRTDMLAKSDAFLRANLAVK